MATVFVLAIFTSTCFLLKLTLNRLEGYLCAYVAQYNEMRAVLKGVKTTLLLLAVVCLFGLTFADDDERAPVLQYRAKYNIAKPEKPGDVRLL